ncbi:MAG: flagellar biosynthesis protein FliQ [Thermoguttaceae bacterium]|jgi:flagellar biosynthetic protein FliQ
MGIDAITSLGRESMTLALLIGAPVLLVGVLVGIVVGVLQSATQIQDQTIAFVCKIVAMFITLAIFLPWIVAKLVEFSQNVLSNIPETATVLLN